MCYLALGVIGVCITPGRNEFGYGGDITHCSNSYCLIILDVPLFDAICTLGCILHFYFSEFALLLSELCIDLALLAAILCRQLAEHIAEQLCDIAEGLLASSLEDEREEETDCHPIGVPAELVWIGGALMMDVALDLLWLGLGETLTPFYALVAVLFTMLLIGAYRRSGGTANLGHASNTLKHQEEENRCCQHCGETLCPQCQGCYNEDCHSNTVLYCLCVAVSRLAES